MFWFSTGAALLLALGIMYLFDPRAATRSFGLPLPEEGANMTWWLRLKGSRGIASGLVVLAVLALSTPRMLGIVLLILAIIPLGDMPLILAARGSIKHAIGIHGTTVALMIGAAIPLLTSQNLLKQGFGKFGTVYAAVLICVRACRISRAGGRPNIRP